MILKLNKFGKFKDASFEISDGITIFYGENESGKTTIFDSLMLLFSENKKSTSFLKQIKLRYGDDIDIETNPEIPNSLKLHPQSYNNLYAIRQSEIIFEMSDGKKDAKDWESEIKKKLFSSDIDVGKMISEIKSEYSGRSQNSVPYKINVLEIEKNEMDEKLYKLYEKISDSSKKKDDLKKLREDGELMESVLKEKIEEYKKLRSFLESKRESETKNIKLETLKRINDFNKANDFLRKNIIFKDDYSEEIKTRTKKIDELKTDLSYLKGKIEALKKSSEDKNEANYQSRKIRIEKALKKIEDYISKSKRVPKIALFIGILLISSSLSLYFKNPLWFIIILPSIPFMFIKENNNEKLINDISDGLPELNITPKEFDVYSLKELLNKELAKIEIIMSEDYGEEIKNYEAEIEAASKELENENNSLNKLFEKLKVENKEEYNDIKRNYDSLLRESEETYKKLTGEARKLGLKDIETLEVDCVRVLKELDEKGVNPKDYNEMEIKKIENDLRDLEIEINVLKEDINKIKNEVSYINGELKNSDNIHKEIITLESESAHINEEIADLNKRKRALKLLEEMLSRISKKNDEIFKSLSKEAKVLYNHIVGKDLSDDGITMSGFDKEKISVLDKQNEKRNVELLSSATKNAVYIAMRLSILSKVHQAGRLILLDDPFITFDKKRTRETLFFIKEYSKNYDMPIAIFTKDEFIRDVFLELKDYEGALIHNLS